MSRLLAEVIYRWRYLLTSFFVAGALLSLPRANITNIDNDITAWFSKSDPVYQDYERFRQEFGGTRSLIIALEAASPDRLFSTGTLRFIEQVTGDIERVDTVSGSTASLPRPWSTPCPRPRCPAADRSRPTQGPARSALARSTTS